MSTGPIGPHHTLHELTPEHETLTKAPSARHNNGRGNQGAIPSLNIRTIRPGHTISYLYLSALSRTRTKSVFSSCMLHGHAHALAHMNYVSMHSEPSTCQRPSHCCCLLLRNAPLNPSPSQVHLLRLVTQTQSGPAETTARRATSRSMAASGT